MNNGAFGEGFPYSNFHDLNMDWIIKIVKDFLDQYTHIQEIISDGEQSLTSLTADGLEQLQNKADNLEALLQTWYDTHSQDIQNQLADALQDLNDWYTLHQNYLDATLIAKIASFNASADQKASETIASIPSDYTSLYNQVQDIDHDLKWYNSKGIYGFVDASADHGNFWLTNLHFVYNANKDQYDVNGNNTVDGQHNIFANSSAFPGNIAPGDIIRCNVDSNMDKNCYVQIFFYVNDSWSNQKLVYYSQFITVPSNATGMLIRIFAYANISISNGYLKFDIVNNPTNANIEKVIPSITPNGDGDQTADIEYLLTKFGTVVLGTGTYVINNLHMPNGSSIRGAGANTILKTTDNTAHGIIPTERCTIEDIQILGTRTGISGTRTSDAGIYIVGNYDNSPMTRNIKINNCYIYGFGLAGIYGKATGYWQANSLSVTNTEICVCYAGILLEDYCEYNRFTNVLCYSNYIGLMNRSGNNVFVNCTFAGNTVGVYLYCDDEDHAMSGNNGHGAIIGCTINHSNNNNGYGILVKGVDTNGFIFSGCNIWFSKVQVEHSTGIVISDCLFGGNTPVIESYYNDTLILRNNTFKETPTFTGAMEHYGNHLFDGTRVDPIS